MNYVITFIEGIITFISPCLLPMLPLYFTYLGGSGNNKKELLKNALGFVCGFTLTFVLLGAFSGLLGQWLIRYQAFLQIIFGLLVILCGLGYMGIFRLSLFQGFHLQINTQHFNFFKSLLFGLIFSISWSPCVGTFLGSALMLAASQSSWLEGMSLLLCYALGLSIPFMLSALVLETLSETFAWIKQHYAMIEKVCGLFLVVVGFLMATGLLGQWLY